MNEMGKKESSVQPSNGGERDGKRKRERELVSEQQEQRAKRKMHSCINNILVYSSMV